MILHLGDNQWAIVDSHLHHTQRVDEASGLSVELPVARWYLDGIGADPNTVQDIFLTHFHKDHYEGVGLLHDYYTQAQLLVTAPLSVELFEHLFNNLAEPTPFRELPDTLERAKQRRRGTFADGLRFLQVGWSRPYGNGVHLRAMSPLDAAIHASASAIAQQMGSGRAAVRTELRNQNWCSVVLHLETPSGCVLLGADLEKAPERFGWDAVLAEPSHVHLSAADIVKVPHHGSAGADHAPMWERLVEAEPVMMVAPFERGSIKLPTQQDSARLCGRGQLYQAAPTSAQWLNEFGFTVERPRRTGVIRARRRAGEARWRITHFGSAFHVNPFVMAGEVDESPPPRPT